MRHATSSARRSCSCGPRVVQSLMAEARPGAGGGREGREARSRAPWRALTTERVEPRTLSPAGASSPTASRAWPPQTVPVHDSDGCVAVPPAPKRLAAPGRPRLHVLRIPASCMSPGGAYPCPRPVSCSPVGCRGARARGAAARRQATWVCAEPAMDSVPRCSRPAGRRTFAAARCDGQCSAMCLTRRRKLLLSVLAICTRVHAHRDRHTEVTDDTDDIAPTTPRAPAATQSDASPSQGLGVSNFGAWYHQVVERPVVP